MSYSPVSWKDKTNKGRVVYDRPRHLYTPADLSRIQKKVLAELTAGPDVSNSEWYYMVLNLLNDTTTAIGAFISRQFLDNKFTGEEVQRITLDLIGILMKAVGIDVSGINKAISDFLNSLAPPPPVAGSAGSTPETTIDYAPLWKKYNKWYKEYVEYYKKEPNAEMIAIIKKDIGLP
jgi:hypothetical protein